MKSNRNISLYWKCQVAGWSMASFYWGYAAFFSSNFRFSIGIADFMLDIAVGIFLTHGYRVIARRGNWYRLSLKALVPRMAAAIIVLSLLYMVLVTGKLYLVRIALAPDMKDPFTDFFTRSGLTIFITGIRLMSIWVLAYHLYHYAQREIATAKENAKLQVMAKEAELNNLAAQLNPHFFFNSLNNIKFLVSENPVAARRAIDLLSDLLRNALYSNHDQLVPVRDEISLVRDYLELEKMRYEERLQTTVTVEEGLDNVLVPPLSIQALVENAIKHGIEKRKDGGEVTVMVQKANGYTCISVRNSGKLDTNSTHAGIGLQNLKERLALQFNGRASLEVTALQDDIVQANILIPTA